MRQTNDEDGAPEGKATKKNPQEKIVNDPLKGGGTSKIVRVHRGPKDDGVTHLSVSPPLTASVSQVLHEVRNEQFMRWPTQMKSDPAARDNTKYCEFHRDYGHRTDNCIQLKREIEYLIQRGYLRRFISPGSQAQNQAQSQAQSQAQNQNQAPTQQPPPQQTTTQHQQPLGEIHVISGGFAGGGESSSARKAHLRSIRSAEMGKIQAVSKLPRLDTTITFSDSDLEGCQHPMTTHKSFARLWPTQQSIGF